MRDMSDECATPDHKGSADAHKKDLDDLEKNLREPPLRYLGYANEVGESFRSFIGKTLVLCSYGVATAYSLTDTVVQSKSVYEANEGKPERTRRTLVTAGDVFLWQMLASVTIPGFVINRICWASGLALSTSVMRSFGVQRWKNAASAGIGLASIPFIVKPIDSLVDYIMDSTYRYGSVIADILRPAIGRIPTMLANLATAGYISADMYSKALKNEKMDNDTAMCATCFKAGDVFMWQVIASMVVPGLIIGALKNIGYSASRRLPFCKCCSHKTRSLIAGAIALTFLPCIQRPVDKTTDYFLDQTYRKL